MFGVGKVLLAIAAFVAIPAAAQAPAVTTTAFDGTYIGVSRTLEGTMLGSRTRGCLPSGQAAPLTIVNGSARTAWAGATAEGSVTPQGALVMHAASGTRFEGQIDSRGSVTGRFSGGCSYQMVWQKKGK